MIWLDDSTTPWMLKLHDGADWIALGSLHAGNKVRVTFKGFGATSESSVALVAALTIDGSPAVAATAVSGAGGALLPLDLQYEYTPGDTSAHSYGLRIGPGAAGGAYRKMDHA